MQTGKLTLASITGIIGSFIASLFGGWTTDLQTLILFMCIDFISGLLVAVLFKNSNKTATGTLSSQAGFKGLCKKCYILLMVLVAHRLDVTLATDYIKTAVIIAFIVNELISIIENAGLMGIPIPSVITSVIDVLRKKAGEVDGDSASTINKKSIQ